MSVFYLLKEISWGEHCAHTRAHLISCVGGATTPPHSHTHFTSSLPFLRPYSPHNHTGVVCLIIILIVVALLPCPPRHLYRRITPYRGHAHLSSRPGYGRCHSGFVPPRQGTNSLADTFRRKDYANVHIPPG